VSSYLFSKYTSYFLDAEVFGGEFGFVTNHGSFVISLKSLDWYRWIFAIFDGEAHPHCSIPQNHAPFIIACTSIKVASYEPSNHVDTAIKPNIFSIEHNLYCRGIKISHMKIIGFLLFEV
jgi:hypothetical protein